jgi:type IV pilus assembly protein PilY1
MQALFYPKRSFDNNTEVDWTSDLMNYWYYFDPFFSAMQIREDTVREGDDTGADAYTLLDLKQDYITNFTYDTSQNKTLAYRWEDTIGKGSTATSNFLGTVPIEDTIPIWRAGFNLWWTDPAVRNIYTSVNGSLQQFTTANSSILDDYLGQTANSTDAKATINFVRGYDCVDAAGDACLCGAVGCSKIGRNRTVTTGVCSSRKSPCESNADCPTGETCSSETHVWKMGDIISSTPRIMGPGYLNTFDLPAPYGYSDRSYYTFIKSNDYGNRQLAFVGANDGMLHAFKLGKLLQRWSGKQWFEAAKQEGETGAGGIGTESYAYIPQNALPYLQYLHDEDYCHINMVDGPTTLTDASINIPTSCTQADYWNCPKITTAPHGLTDFTETSWRTTLIGSMGIGGATCDAATPDSDRISTPLSVSGNPVGWSSYFALDVTDQAGPQLLWEFSHADLGVTNVGPGIVKVGGSEKRCTNNDTITCSTNSDCGSDPSDECVTTNGRWFAILASGSTGPISSQEFKGTSDKNLKLFVLDLKTGALVRTIDTGITNAFAGSISTGALDLDKSFINLNGNYEDDAFYIGYVKDTTSGGVLRLVIDDNIDPANWTYSKVFNDGEVGPVTTSVANLFDRKTGKLWLYFAEGRYSYKTDDLPTTRKLFGVQEPCYDSTTNSITSVCTPLGLTDLKDQTSSPTSTLTASEKGWYINMDAATTGMAAERVISNPTPDSLGAIYFLSFAPTSDICGYGGTTYLWGLDYQSGGHVTYEMQGKALIQVSTGEIKELKLSDAFTENDNRKSVGFKGIPPAGQGIMIVSNPPPLKKYMHVQEQ